MGGSQSWGANGKECHMGTTNVLRRAVRLLGVVAVTGVASAGVLGSTSASAQTSAAPDSAQQASGYHRQYGNGLGALANGLAGSAKVSGNGLNSTGNGLNSTANGLAFSRDANGL